MKISKRLLGIMGVIGVLVAAVIIFNMWNGAVKSRDTAGLNLNNARKLYSIAVTQKTDVINQIAQIEITIKQGQEQVTKLQTDLAQAGKDLQQAKAQFPALAESIEYSEYLLGFAKTANLKVITLTSSEPDIAGISTKTDVFYGTTFTIDLQGKITDILTFMDTIVKNSSFISSNIDSIAFDILVPLTQAQKDSIKTAFKADIKASLISTAEANQLALITGRQALWDEERALYEEKLASTRAGLTPYAMLVYTEQAIMSVVGGRNPTIITPQTMTTDKMAADIRSLIGSLVGPDIANQYTPDIVDAIEREVAAQLIDIVSGIVGQAIGALFEAGTPELTPQFGGVLGEEITLALEGVPPSLVGGLVTELLKTRIQTVLDENLAALAGPKPVEPPAITPLDLKVVEQAAEQQAEKEATQKAILEIALQSGAIENSTTSTITLTIFTYKGS